MNWKKICFWDWTRTRKVSPKGEGMVVVPLHVQMSTKYGLGWFWLKKIFCRPQGVPIIFNKLLFSQLQILFYSSICLFKLKFLHTMYILNSSNVLRNQMVKIINSRHTVPLSNQYYTNPVSSYTHTMMVFKFEVLNFLFSHKLINSRPCRELNPGPPRWQAPVLTIELWLLDMGK